VRYPSQCIIFKTVYAPRHTSETSVPRFAVEGRGHLPEVMQNDRLVSYIRTIIISQGKAFQYLEVDIMELLFTVLHPMQSLRDIKLFDIPFTTIMLDQLCKVLSTRLYNVELWSCSYPAGYTIQQTALKIHRLMLMLKRLGWSTSANRSMAHHRLRRPRRLLRLLKGLYIVFRALPCHQAWGYWLISVQCHDSQASIFC